MVNILQVSYRMHAWALYYTGPSGQYSIRIGTHPVTITYMGQVVRANMPVWYSQTGMFNIH